MGASAAAPSARMVVDAHRARRVLDFELRPGAEQETELVLNTVYSILAVRLLEERLGSTVQEAVEIQKSLLPERVPPFPDFEIALRSVAADLVGGDCYDFLDFGGGTLGIAIGDASGHGLPAALLVRDVVVGLRMGLEKELKPEHALEKLNRVIHASTLSSSFVSLFYAELEQNGNLFYYNAGHEPPLLFAEGRSAALARGGTVLGPLPEMRPKRHFAHVDRGATLVLYTDGLIERKDAHGELFGLERLERTLAERIAEPPQSLVDAVFAAVTAHGEGAPWDDDATLLVVRREP
jgi:sigma-B regulation protein RsbU (phosphoserine phosphatase)